MENTENRSVHFAKELFDVFVTVCSKYKVNFATPINNMEVANVVPAATLTTPQVKVKKSRSKAKRKRPTAPNKVYDFIDWFVKSPAEDIYTVSRGAWKCLSESGVWTLKFFTEDQAIKRRKDLAQSIVAFRPINKPDLVMMNGGSLGRAGSRWGVSPIQQHLMDIGAMPVPLRLIMTPEEGIGQPIAAINVLDWAGHETLTVLQPNTWNTELPLIINRHFAGAAVIEAGDNYFLLDVDRKEVDCFNFNAFFTKLPKPATTVQEAYKLITPKEVTERPYIRQGELFFIPVPVEEVTALMLDGATPIAKTTFDRAYSTLINLANKIADTEYSNVIEATAHRIAEYEKRPRETEFTLEEILNLNKLKSVYPMPEVHSGTSHEYISSLKTMLNPMGFAGSLHITAQANISINPDEGQQQRNWGDRHTATLIFNPEGDTYYAYGAVTHSQHYPLMLKQWYRVYKSTAAANWNVTGEID